MGNAAFTHFMKVEDAIKADVIKVHTAVSRMMEENKNLKTKNNNLESEIEGLKIHVHSLREENAILQEQGEFLRSQNQKLWDEFSLFKKEMRILKEETRKEIFAKNIAAEKLKEDVEHTRNAMLKLIDYSKSLNALKRLGKLEEAVFRESSKNEELDYKDEEEEMRRRLRRFMMEEEDGRTPGIESKPEGSQSAKPDLISEGTSSKSFLEQTIIDPVKRRELISLGKLPRPFPNMDALNNLPKYRGCTEGVTTEKLQNYTMDWLRKVEGVITAQDANVQDVYDKLPNLLDGAAKIWFQQTVKNNGHFVKWSEFRQALIRMFLGPEWKRNLENSFATIKQREKEPGISFMLRVYDHALQIDPNYDEAGIMTKIAVGMNPKLWQKIPFEKRADYASLISCITIYDNEQNEEIPRFQPKNRSYNPNFNKKNSQPEKKEKQQSPHCYLCGSSGHYSSNCPKKKNVNAATTDDKPKSGKGKGTLPRTE
jgi:hypothetical protein